MQVKTSINTVEIPVSPMPVGKTDRTSVPSNTFHCLKLMIVRGVGPDIPAKLTSEVLERVDEVF